MHSLPEKYIIVQAVVFKSVELSVPAIKISDVSVDVHVHVEATGEENRWIEHAIQLMQKDLAGQGAIVHEYLDGPFYLKQRIIEVWLQSTASLLKKVLML